jgi:hypothetical protein
MLAVFFAFEAPNCSSTSHIASLNTLTLLYHERVRTVLGSTLLHLHSTSLHFLPCYNSSE